MKTPEELERHRERQRTYKFRHPERVRESNRKWDAANQEKRMEVKRTWNREHPKAWNLIHSRSDTIRRARKLGVETERFTWLEIANRDDWTCQSCGTQIWECMRGRNVPTAPHIDHIVPLSRGGPHTRSNSQLLCAGCNLRKHNKIPVEAV